LSAAKSEGCRAEAESAGGLGLAYINHRSKLRLGKPVKWRVLRRSASTDGLLPMEFFYVYILQSESDAGRFYVGLTDDLRARLIKHNKGDVPHTSKFCPWKIKTAIAFPNRERASQFENYLKTASGRAFTKKRL
jgi:predicted GIY-YIG superfamily endonuclease